MKYLLIIFVTATMIGCREARKQPPQDITHEVFFQYPDPDTPIIRISRINRVSIDTFFWDPKEMIVTEFWEQEKPTDSLAELYSEIDRLKAEVERLKNKMIWK